jgi:hypothetical protein
MKNSTSTTSAPAATTPHGNPIVDFLDSVIARTQEQHAKVRARDVIAPGSRWEGLPPSEAALRADGGPFVRCTYAVGGCNQTGYIEGQDENGAPRRIVDPLCHGVGRFFSVSSLADLVAFREIAAGDTKPDAAAEALASWNRNSAERHAAKQKDERDRQQRQQAERDLLLKTAAAVERIRSGDAPPPIDPVTETALRRRALEAQDKPSPARR